MRATYALIRASWLTASSYRLALLLSLGGLLLSVVPLYFVTNALQPLMADKIDGEGGQYFGFVVVGLVVSGLLPTMVRGLPTAFGGGITSGTLEAVLGTPARLPAILLGFTGYEVLWGIVRGTLLLAGASVLGADLAWGRVLPALLVLVLILLAYLPIGLLGASMVLAFRTTGPLPRIAMLSATLLGGVYYPTTVIPAWLEGVSAFIPLTYGLRALRRVLLEGQPLMASATDLGILVAIDVGLLVVTSWVLLRALRHARRSGLLSQY